MSITRAKQSSLRTGVTKYDNLRAGLPFTPTIGTATDGGTGSTVSVAFTANNTAGLTYTALSTPGSLTGTSTTSPITVSGLTSGTAYTFQVNATNSAGTSPYSAASNSVTPVTPSSYESIASQTLGSNTSSITFSSIPSTYKSLQIRFLAKDAFNGNVFLQVQLNADTNDYTSHRLSGNGTTASADGSVTQSGANIQINGTNYDTNTFTAGIVDIHDYAVAGKNRTVRAFAGGDNNGAGIAGLWSSLWPYTTAVSSIRITSNGTNLRAGSTFALYGIKGE